MYAWQFKVEAVRRWLSAISHVVTFLNDFFPLLVVTDSGRELIHHRRRSRAVSTSDVDHVHILEREQSTVSLGGLSVKNGAVSLNMVAEAAHRWNELCVISSICRTIASFFEFDTVLQCLYLLPLSSGSKKMRSCWL